MKQPAAREGDRMIGMDVHVVLVPAGASEVPTPAPCVFRGTLGGSLSPDVRIGGKPAAVVGSTAPVEHQPPPGTRFEKPLTKNQGTIRSGSATVRINGRRAARTGPTMLACDDSGGSARGTVVVGEPTPGSGPVTIG